MQLSLDHIRVRTYCIVFAILGALPYLASLAAGFVFDDADAIVGNPLVNGEVDLTLRSLFMRDFWGLTASESVGSYRPLAVLSFALEYRLSGGQAWVLHLSNLLFHSATCAALFGLLQNRFGKSTAAIATLLFSVHALHTENIAALVARADVMATLLVLLSLWLTREKARFSWLAGLSFFLALLAKETAVAALAIVLADLVLNLSGAPSRRKRIVALCSMLIAFAVYLLLRVTALEMLSAPAHLPGNPIAEASFSARLYTSAALLSHSTSLLLVPLRLVADYSYPAYPVHTSLWSAAVIAGFALWILIPCSIVFFRRRDPAIAWGAAIFLAGYFPISNVAALVPTIYADRLLYLPSIGFVIIVARVLQHGHAGLKNNTLFRYTLIAVFSLMLLFHGLRSIVRTSDWESNRSIFTSAVTSPPAGLLTHIQLGNLERIEGNLQTSAEYYRRAIEVAPRYGAPYAGLGLTLDLLGDPKAAHKLLLRALQVTPTCLQCQTSIIQFYLKYGRFPQAAAHLEKLESLPGSKNKARPLRRQYNELLERYRAPE